VQLLHGYSCFAPLPHGGGNLKSFIFSSIFSCAPKGNYDSIKISLYISGILPIKVYKDLSNPENLKSELHKIGGVYGFVNVKDLKNIKQYIGSSKDLYQRFLDHYKGRDTNIRLKRSILKYGIENFNFVIYY
jgi:hypothetical protein